MKNKHRFVLTVTTTRSKQGAKNAVLASFACRNPDGCEFRVSDYRKPRQHIAYIHSTRNYLA